jgi:hypothetical protein
MSKCRQTPARSFDRRRRAHPVATWQDALVALFRLVLTQFALALAQLRGGFFEYLTEGQQQAPGAGLRPHHRHPPIRMLTLHAWPMSRWLLARMMM